VSFRNVAVSVPAFKYKNGIVIPKQNGDRKTDGRTKTQKENEHKVENVSALSGLQPYPIPRAAPFGAVVVL
jgi:hypothetical protein